MRQTICDDIALRKHTSSVFSIGFRRRTWAEIDLDAAEFNFLQMKNKLPDATKICCVIKANGYGHGATELAKLYQELGASYFAVSNIEEAIQLRHAGNKTPILILGYTPEECANILAEYNITQCVYSPEYANILNEQAGKYHVSLKIHIKLDTGMGRIGFRAMDEQSLEQCIREIQQIHTLSHLKIEGVFTHFAEADAGNSGNDYTKFQYHFFEQVKNAMKGMGFNSLIFHCANSASILDYDMFYENMVRAGIILYGLQPSGNIRNPLKLRPVMTLKTVISHIKTVKAGDTISYGRTFQADRDMSIATVPIGYADGMHRSSGNAGICLTIHGKKAPIVGRVCMDQTMLDVTNIPECKLNDEVIVFGESPAMTADEFAAKDNTIGYEVICAVGERIPRLYKRHGELIKICDSLVPWMNEKDNE